MVRSFQQTAARMCRSLLPIAGLLVLSACTPWAQVSPASRSLEIPTGIDLYRPEAIGLLTEMLEDHRASIRRDAIDILIDLAPDTESVQPELRRALKDEDVVVARDAARA